MMPPLDGVITGIAAAIGGSWGWVEFRAGKHLPWSPIAFLCGCVLWIYACFVLLSWSTMVDAPAIINCRSLDAGGSFDSIARCKGGLLVVQDAPCKGGVYVGSPSGSDGWRGSLAVWNCPGTAK